MSHLFQATLPTLVQCMAYDICSGCIQPNVINTLTSHGCLPTAALAKHSQKNLNERKHL